MGLGHDRDDGDARGGTHGLGAKLREKRLAVFLGDRLDELDQLGGATKAVPPRRLVLHRVQVDHLALGDGVDHRRHDLADGAHARLVLRHDVHLNHRAAAKRPTQSRGRG